MGSDRVDRALSPLIGWTVWRCCVDSQFSLLLYGEGDGPSAEVVIEAEFRYVDPLGAVHLLSPGTDAEKLGPALRLFTQKCIGASGDEDGGLALSFADGSQLEVAPSRYCEAWQITELGLISLPGGGLSLTPT
jgi:hypothetical protein